MTAAGVFDSADNSMTLQGEEQDPSRGAIQKYDIVFHFISPTRYVSEVIFKSETPVGGHTKFKVAEVTYTPK